jgi:type IV secretion system protein VirB6
MATTFYSDLFSDLNSILHTYVGSVSAKMAESMGDFAKPLLGIYIALWGWSMMRGAIQEPVLDGFTRIVRLVFIVGLAINIGHYNTYISDRLFHTPDDLAELIVSAAHIEGSNSDTSSNMTYLDTAMSSFDDIGKSFRLEAKDRGDWGIPDLSLYLTGWALYVAGAAITAYCAFLLSLCKIALALLLGMGPLFVLFLIFESTKRFFETWIGQIINYIFLVTLTAGAMSLVLFIIMGYLTTTGATLEATPVLSKAFPAIIFSIIGLLVMIQVPSIASALGGGVAISTLGAAAAAAGAATRATRAAAGGAWNLASGKTFHDAKRRLAMARSQYKAVGRGAAAVGRGAVAAGAAAGRGAAAAGRGAAAAGAAAGRGAAAAGSAAGRGAKAVYNRITNRKASVGSG